MNNKNEDKSNIKLKFTEFLTKAKNFFTKKHKGISTWIFFAAAAVVIIILLIIFLPRNNQNTITIQTEAQAVKVSAFSPTGSDVVLNYAGTIQPETTQNVSYTGISELTNIYVNEGDKVSTGQIVATVDTSNAQTALSNAESALVAAQASQERAELNCNRAQNNLDTAKSYEAKENALTTAQKELDEAIAQRDALDPSDPQYAQAQQNVEEKQKAKDEAQSAYDEIRYQKETMDRIAENNGFTDAVSYYEYELKTANTTLEEANSALNSAQSNYEEAQDNLEKCNIRSELDGYVITVLLNEGETCTPINPIMVIGSGSTVVTVGISQTDIKEIAIGQTCDIILNGNTLNGSVKSIGQIPDTSSRTYEVQVTLPDLSEGYFIGELATVKIHIGERTGIWLPINIIMNDGEDYVFVVEDEHAVKKYIKITDISNDMVLVSGLDEGGYVVIEGMKNLKSGNLVKVIE